MKKENETTPSFVAEFELEASSKGFSQLEKINNAYRQIYNATLGGGCDERNSKQQQQ